MKVYLAARYSRHREMQEYAAELCALGYIVTARWILGDHELRSDGQSDRDDWMMRWAVEDWDDLTDADLVVSFTEGPGPVAGRARGGRHTEFGAALALCKPVVIIGHRENVFHFLPIVEFYPDWASFRATLATPTPPSAAAQGRAETPQGAA